MKVCLFCTLFWLAHLIILSFANGSDREEGYKPRRWTSSGDGPYRMVVSSESETLEQEESVSLGVAQEKKKEKGPEDGEKVTQRMILKRTRKRLPAEVVNPRKRRRNPAAASTTGLPQTMSYNLYNHFRPLEQDLPQDHLLPFLDFGRKLSTGSTPSGVNSIESSSTPRGAAPRTKDEDEDVFHEDMDVTVIRKAVERNSVPRGPIQMKPHIVAFFRRNSTELIPINNKTLTNLSNDIRNKTDIKDVQYDLQSNESGVKLHAVLSPNYGLRLNKTDNATVDSKESESSSKSNNETKTDTDSSKEAVLETKSADNNTSVLTQQSNITEPKVKASNISTDIQKSAVKLQTSEITEKPLTLADDGHEEVQTNEPKTSPNETLHSRNPVEAIVSSPKPTARILSTAVVTSVSVKESPRSPRIKTNLTRPLDSFQRLTVKNVTAELMNITSHFNVESRIRSDNHSILGLPSVRRKVYTTLRPKTPTYRPVTFRNVFRRNLTNLGYGVVHILSTPPTYIEVPKIIPNSPVKLVNSDSKVPPIISSTTVTHPNISSNDQETTLETTTPPTSTTSTTAATTSTTPETKTSPSTTTPSTTPPTTPSSTTSSTPIPSSAPPTPPSTVTHTIPSTTTAIVPAVTTTVASVTMQSMSPTILPKPIQTADINHEMGHEVLPTEEIPQILDAFSPEETTLHFENTTVEIEFKPLDVQLSSTTESPSNVTRLPSLLWIYSQRNNSGVRTQNVGVAYSDSHIGLVTYVLAGLALIPLLLGLSVLGRQIFRKSKKKVLDESEYSSEYNRTPLPTKLPRVPAHINWDAEKGTVGAPPATPQVPVTKWEFSRDKLRLQTVLGQGNFGQVWKAEADDLSGHEGSTRLVAVKTVKEGASLREKEDLLRELGIMQELGAHPNVVTLLGCCTEKEPYFLIMEYVMYGKLLAFLREHRTRAHYFNFSDLSSALTSRDLTCFAYCVARGMEYLVSKGIIHRDLAARNILVDHTKLCKIADFGMSRNVQDTGQIYEQRPNRGALPIRWMAPESLHLSLFTHKSDVWSFGILLWEIITLGSTPYSKIGAREVMHLVKEGYRLEKPKHCRPEFYKVLTKCWHSDPARRPSFTDLKQDLAALLADEQTNGEYVDLEALTEEMCDQSS